MRLRQPAKQMLLKSSTPKTSSHKTTTQIYGERMNTDFDFDPFDLEAQDQDAEAQAHANAVASKLERDDFLVLMRDKVFRRFMWRLLSMTHVFRSSFMGAGTDALAMAFLEGERNIGCRMVDEIHQHCSELYSTMVKEQKNDRNNRNNSDADSD